MSAWQLMDPSERGIVAAFWIGIASLPVWVIGGLVCILTAAGMLMLAICASLIAGTGNSSQTSAKIKEGRANERPRLHVNRVSPRATRPVPALVQVL